MTTIGSTTRDEISGNSHRHVYIDYLYSVDVHGAGMAVGRTVGDMHRYRQENYVESRGYEKKIMALSVLRMETCVMCLH